MTAAVVAVLIVSALSVSAAEPEDTFVSNMDAETYRAQRNAQIKAAWDAETITEAEATALYEHVEEVALDGSYGNGPTFGEKGDGNATCVLGEDSALGIFRSESAGLRTGNGNGVGDQLRDGSGAGQGNNGNGNAGRGTGQGGRGQ